MALRDYAEMAQDGPVSTTKSPTDRLSLLPKELLDMIYSFIFQSENGPWTIHIKQKSRDAGFSESDPDRILPILALPRDRKYKARRREDPDERWPDNIEEAFFRGLDWTYNHPPHYYNTTISEIIYELTGTRRCRKLVSSHIQVLKGWVHDFKPASEHMVTSVHDSISTLRNLNASNDIDEITETITRIQSQLPDLLSAFQKEHETATPIPPQPRLLNFASSPPITPRTELFRTLSTITSDPNAYLSISLLPKPSNPITLLSLTLLNRFHRTHSLPILASSLVFDFNDNIKAIYAFHDTLRVSSPGISRMRLLFVEGYMHVRFVECLLAAAAVCGLVDDDDTNKNKNNNNNNNNNKNKNNNLPSLRELSIEIWPRDPMREDRANRAWGEQTVKLLEVLEGFKGGVVVVIVEFRLEGDWVRFEREYMGKGGWRRRRMGVAGEEEVVVDGVRERGEKEEGFRRRCYELKG